MDKVKSEKWIFRSDLYDRSDPNAITSIKDLMKITGLTRNTINAHLPVSEFNRENKSIIGIKPIILEPYIPSIIKNLQPLLPQKIPEENLKETLEEILEPILEVDELPNEILEKSSMPKRGRPAKPVNRDSTIQILHESLEKSRDLNDTIANSYNCLLIDTKQAKKEPIPTWLKSRVWVQQNGTASSVKCPICKDTMISSESFSAGHIIPESKGGQLCVPNLMAICCDCNSQMGARHLYWFAWHYYQRVFWPLI
jgi:hypothetical protein